MARSPRPTRALMLEAAETLLRERGLTGAGIHRVIARSGAPIGSLYHFFPGGKTELVTEALQVQGEKARALFQRFLEDRSEPLPERVRRLFRTAASGFDSAGRDKGCAIGAVALDLEARHDALRKVCLDAFEGWTASIARELPWSDEALRRSFAEMVVAALEGAFILSRARRSGRPFVTVGDWLAAMLDQPPQRAMPHTKRQRQRRQQRTR